ncbi:hypothetical protein BGZ80_000632, partial [Entomortierella chlamydospora]
FALSTVAIVLSVGLLISKVDSAALPEVQTEAVASLTERNCQYICEVSCKNNTTGEIINVAGAVCGGCPTCPSGYTAVDN